VTFLRRISTRQLLALAGVVVVVAAGTTAIAIAATGGGPTPPPKPLANAVHDALAAPPVEGVTARVHFTNDLIGESVLEGADPLLGGASGRLWASADGRLRLELQADVSKGSAGDLQVLVDRNRFSAYDPGTETVYQGSLPRRDAQAKGEAGQDEAPSLARVQTGIEEAMEHANLSGAIPSDVAGNATYTLRASPKANGGLVGGAELAWDAANGTPLRAAVYARGDSSPVLELAATEISFGPVSDSVFEVTPPPSAKVVDLNPTEPSSGEGGDTAPVIGLEAIQRQISFQLSAPPSLAGMQRDEVRLVSSGGDGGALVTYGKGLGGIAVLELPTKQAATGEGEETGGLRLPGVTIDSATKGEELETPLGTLIRFRRGGVDYAVAGSVAPAVAKEAAQGL
jgi:outer membrane lipoprotein-sorting protein